MRLFWWQQLPLLIILQLLEPSRSNQRLYIGSPQQFSNWAGRQPCLQPWKSVACYVLKDPTVVSSSTHGKIIDLPPCASCPSRTSNHLQTDFYKSRKTRIVAKVGGDPGVPTLTPSQIAHVERPRKHRFAAVIGACVGAAVLVVITVAVVYICLMRAKRYMRRASETASSVSSSPADMARESGSPHVGALSPHDTQDLRQLTVAELELATCNFSQSKIIGEGGFGLVYKGLLQDGSIVVIKRRLHDPSQYFLEEVKNIGRVKNKHLVKLIGYCEEIHEQFLVYDHLPKGDVGNHLYDSEGLPTGKLALRQRLSIALDAAKGLDHLHCMVPPLLHLHFRTSNVLLDDNYNAKVSDFGLSKLLVEGNRAGSSSAIDCFLDPELRLSKELSERSDVYSFGVFLLELITGHEALNRNQSNSQQNLVEQAKGIEGLEHFVDNTLGKNNMDAVKQMMKLALQCVDTGVRRPTMKTVVEELKLIHERETGNLNTELGGEIAGVTLGSDLFK